MSSFDPRKLLDPAAYPHRPRRVELAETHISWVYLAGDLVYKVKKPVDFGFLNYSSLRRRKHFCHEEVRLNRRLCPDAYLGVEKIIPRGDGVTLGGDGRAIEYAVVMRRLPANRMLDHLIRTGEVTESMIDRVAARIAAFHADAERGPEIDPAGSIAMVREHWQENFNQIEPFLDRTISRAHLSVVRSFVERFLDERQDVFEHRVSDGFIRDCHGDMRAESICVTNGLCIFDCIEFSDSLRQGDTASELAFLAMDIDARGRPDLAYWLVDRYIAATGDRGLWAVLLFYACYRAFVRGKVQSFRLDQPVEHESAHRTARRRARHYLQLAWSYARAPEHLPLVLVAGLPGTGKTTLARALAMRLGAEVISSDRVRKELADIDVARGAPVAFERGLYAPDMTRRTYGRMLERANELLARGQAVILDATFRARTDRAAACALARSTGRDAYIILSELSETATLERIRRREVSGEGSSDADVAIYLAQRGSFEPIGPDEGIVLTVDTAGPVARTARRTMESILQAGSAQRRR